MSISVFIDADNCPNLVLKKTAELCRKNNFILKIIANRQINIPDAAYEMHICPAEKDAADNFILEYATSKDLVITKDLLFAEKLVEKDIVSINDRGTMFDKYNIKDRLQDRALDLQLAGLGFGGKKGSTYNEKQLAKFTSCFEKAISILLRRDNP